MVGNLPSLTIPQALAIDPGTWEIGMLFLNSAKALGWQTNPPHIGNMKARLEFIGGFEDVRKIGDLLKELSKKIMGINS